MKLFTSFSIQIYFCLLKSSLSFKTYSLKLVLNTCSLTRNDLQFKITSFKYLEDARFFSLHVITLSKFKGNVSESSQSLRNSFCKAPDNSSCVR